MRASSVYALAYVIYSRYVGTIRHSLSVDIGTASVCASARPACVIRYLERMGERTRYGRRYTKRRDRQLYYRIIESRTESISNVIRARIAIRWARELVSLGNLRLIENRRFVQIRARLFTSTISGPDSS